MAGYTTFKNLQIPTQAYNTPTYQQCSAAAMIPYTYMNLPFTSATLDQYIQQCSTSPSGMGCLGVTVDYVQSNICMIMTMMYMPGTAQSITSLTATAGSFCLYISNGESVQQD